MCVCVCLCVLVVAATIQREDLLREKNTAKMVEGEGKKTRNVWPRTLRAKPPFGPSTLLWAPHLMGLNFGPTQKSDVYRHFEISEQIPYFHRLIFYTPKNGQSRIGQSRIRPLNFRLGQSRIGPSRIGLSRKGRWPKSKLAQVEPARLNALPGENWTSNQKVVTDEKINPKILMDEKSRKILKSNQKIVMKNWFRTA